MVLSPPRYARQKDEACGFKGPFKTCKTSSPELQGPVGDGLAWIEERTADEGIVEEKADDEGIGEDEAAGDEEALYDGAAYEGAPYGWVVFEGIP